MLNQARQRSGMKFVGRERELETLMGVFACATAGGARVVLVQGPPGSGKTALVQEAVARCRAAGAYALGGKCDYLGRHVPYAVIRQAIKMFMRDTLMEDESTVRQWTTDFQAAFGAYGGILNELFPPLNTVIAAAPAPTFLHGLERRTAVRHLLLQLLRTITIRKERVVLFLDDLQWADDATLELLDAVSSEPALDRLLIVGTMRSGASEASGMRLRHLGGVDRIDLAPFSATEVGALLAATYGCSDAQAGPLAGAILASTSGLPMDVLCLVDILTGRDLVRYDLTQEQQVCHLAGIPAALDPVTGLGPSRLAAASAKTFAVLRVAACFRSSFEPQQLASVAGLPLDEVIVALREAASLGLVDAVDEGYQFCHDLIQQEAYDANNASQRCETHLRIAGVMLEQEADHEAGARNLSFTIADHLNASGELATDSSRIDATIQTNIVAGMQACVFRPTWTLRSQRGHRRMTRGSVLKTQHFPFAC